MKVDPESIREYAARPWREVSEARLRWHASRTSGDRREEVAALARSTSEAVMRLHPDLAWSATRALDLEAHVHLKELLDRASRSLPPR